MSAVVWVIVGDVLGGVFLLLSAARQERHKEAVVSVGSFLLVAAAVLSLITGN